MLWYQEGGLPQALPPVVYNDKNQSITNPLNRSVEELNSWGWFKCPDIINYNTFYFTHEWGGSDWVYNVTPYNIRKQRFESKKNKFIAILRTWQREARYNVILSTEAGGETPADLQQYLNDLKAETIKLVSFDYVDAGIDSNLSDMDSFATQESIDKTANSDSLDFWYNYSNLSMPVQQQGGFTIFG